LFNKAKSNEGRIGDIASFVYLNPESLKDSNVRGPP